MTVLPTVHTASAALERYRTALENDQLIQEEWHDTASDGRWLACALGVIGDEVEASADCPAEVMPEWLAECVQHFFDDLPFDKAKAWGLAFYEELARLRGNVPIRVYHRFMAEHVLSLAAEHAGEARPVVEQVAALHTRALDGDMPGKGEWSAAWAAVEAAAGAARAAWAAVEAAAGAARAAWAAASAAWAAAGEAAEAAAREKLAYGLIDAMRAEQVAA